MTVLTNVAGLLILFGFISIGFNLASGQVTTKRKPAYWLALLMSAALVAIYIDFLGELFRGLEMFPEWSIRAAFVVVYILLGCLLVLIPWIDRQEWREQTQASERLSDRIREIGVDTEELYLREQDDEV